LNVWLHFGDELLLTEVKLCDVFISSLSVCSCIMPTCLLNECERKKDTLLSLLYVGCCLGSWRHCVIVLRQTTNSWASRKACD